MHVVDVNRVPQLQVANHAVVIGDGGDFVSYAGVPMVTADGCVIGCLSVADRRPRRWTEAEVGALCELAEVVTAEVELRLEVWRLAKAEQASPL